MDATLANKKRGRGQYASGLLLGPPLHTAYECHNRPTGAHTTVFAGYIPSTYLLTEKDS